MVVGAALVVVVVVAWVVMGAWVVVVAWIVVGSWVVVDSWVVVVVVVVISAGGIVVVVVDDDWRMFAFRLFLFDDCCIPIEEDRFRWFAIFKKRPSLTPCQELTSLHKDSQLVLI